MLRINWIFTILTVLLIGSCQPPAPDAASGKLRIVCTTGMIADAVSQVVGDRAEVLSLMGPGVDPHLYKASQGDLRLLNQADLVFYNGLHLEGKMGEILEKLGRTRPVFAVSEGIESGRLIASGDGVYDPHIWFDVQMWAGVVAHIGSVLSEHDGRHAAEYEQAASVYGDSLLRLDEWVREEIAGIPKTQRVLITAHDAFSYFGRAYGIEVRGLQGISTMSEYGLKDVTDLADFILERKIPAVFVESSVPEKSLEAVVEGCRARGHEVRIGGSLFSDAMGEAGTPEGSYTGMVRANVRAIVDGLKPNDHGQDSH